MSAASDRAVAALDRRLGEVGQDIVLRKLGSPDVDCDVRAQIEDLEGSDLAEASNLAQRHSRVIMSPTEITGAGWPAPTARTPREGDKVVAQSRERNVDRVKEFRVDGTLVRIELFVAG